MNTKLNLFQHILFRFKSNPSFVILIFFVVFIIFAVFFVTKISLVATSLPFLHDEQITVLTADSSHQQNITGISGVVLHESNDRPIGESTAAELSITIVDKKTMGIKFLDNVSVDPSGEYAISELEPGEYIVILSNNSIYLTTSADQVDLLTNEGQIEQANFEIEDPVDGDDGPLPPTGDDIRNFRSPTGDDIRNFRYENSAQKRLEDSMLNAALFLSDPSVDLTANDARTRKSSETASHSQEEAQFLYLPFLQDVVPGDKNGK